MRRFSHRFRYAWWLVLLAISLLVAKPAQAQSKTFYWQRYDVDVTVQPNGDLLVEERQTIVFTSGTFRFGYRTIPLEKTDGIEGIELWEGGQQYDSSSSERDYTFSQEKDGNELHVRWHFPPTSGSMHTFTFRYTVRGGVRINPEEGDSIFWKAIPPDHSFRIENARVNVRFPAGVELGDIVTYGAQAKHSREGDTVTFVATRGLVAQQELEIGIAFAPGLIQAEKPEWQKAQERAEILNVVLGAAGALTLVIGLLAILVVWYMRGRDPEVGPVADYLSEPPSTIRPGVAGTLVDERADMQDVIASLVDLARRGYMEMVETEASLGLLGLGSGSQFTFRRTDKPWDSLESFETAILQKIFGNRQERSLGDLKNEFYTAIPKVKKGLYHQTVAHQFFLTDPETVRGRYSCLGITLLIITGGIGYLAVKLWGGGLSAIFCPFVSVGIAGLALVFTGRVMPVKTRRGAEEAAKWKAFKRYLQHIDRYTQLEEATEQFDRYLPYAIAFGIERSWINRFAAVPSTPIPVWYYPAWVGTRSTGGRSRSVEGGRGVRAPSLDGMSKGMATGLSSMSAGLTSMLNTAGSTMVSRPQSSGSGGGSWSGGGFSGGGGGGGGSAGFG